MTNVIGPRMYARHVEPAYRSPVSRSWLSTLSLRERSFEAHCVRVGPARVQGEAFQKRWRSVPMRKDA